MVTFKKNKQKKFLIIKNNRSNQTFQKNLMQPQENYSDIGNTTADSSKEDDKPGTKVHCYQL